MATIIITGSKGQLGRAIANAAATDYPGHKLILTDVDELDIRDADAVDTFLKVNPADFLVNCAAYTAVDQAEDEPEAAHALNVLGVANLAISCNRYNTGLIHISTDYIFDGASPHPYFESHTANPVSVYGKSKYEGEISIMYHLKKAIIIRTSWLYYHGGKNFISTILHKARETGHLRVVFDQVGSPTYALDLARIILKIAGMPQPNNGVVVYHYANRGLASWYDFAKAITALAGISCKIDPCATSELRQKAIRPSFSVLNCSKIATELESEIPHWMDSLKSYLEKENGDNKN
ncbi:MAG: dTDP-4-dehydrorhamnose reductase [Bacteroidales bacterium]